MAYLHGFVYIDVVFAANSLCYMVQPDWYILIDLVRFYGQVVAQKGHITSICPSHAYVIHVYEHRVHGVRKEAHSDLYSENDKPQMRLVQPGFKKRKLKT